MSNMRKVPHSEEFHNSVCFNDICHNTSLWIPINPVAIVSSAMQLHVLLEILWRLCFWYGFAFRIDKILIRLWWFKIGPCADIDATLTQVEVPETEQCFYRFWWREGQPSGYDTLQNNGHIFGKISHISNLCKFCSSIDRSWQCQTLPCSFEAYFHFLCCRRYSTIHVKVLQLHQLVFWWNRWRRVAAIGISSSLRF